MYPVIIVPYRDREDHLREFVPAIKEKLPLSRVFVIEQLGQELFNKGSLINIGVIESHGDYYMFHDVDQIPVDVEYTYPCHGPVHIAIEMQQFGYKMPYENFFGGCVTFTREHFKAVNGFTNKIKGWGFEDDLFHDSFVDKYIPIFRNYNKGRFNSLPHKQNNSNAKQNGINSDIHRAGRDFSEGMSTVRYKIEEYSSKADYTHIKVTLLP